MSAELGTSVPRPVARPRFAGWSWLGWWLPVAAVTGVVVGAFGPDLAVVFGYRSLGAVAGVGQPLARTLGIGAATVALAALLLAVVYVPGRARGALSRVGHDALRVVPGACAVLAVSALAVAVLTVAETVGLRPGALLVDPPTLAVALGTVEPAGGWAVAALVAAIVGVLARTVLTWRGGTGLLALLLVGMAVPAMTAVGNSERSHDWYGDALTLHTLAALLWLGSTSSLVALGRQGGLSDVVRRRHARLALGCSLVLVGSGLVPAALDVGVAALFTSGYGLLVVASGVLLVAALVAARRWQPAPCGRLIAMEGGLLTAAAVAGASMTRLLPPGEEGQEPDRLTFLLGYGLPPRMGWAELAGWWRVDLLFVPLAVLAAAGYLLALRRLRRDGGTWPAARTAAWLAGALTVVVATSSGVGAYATAVLPAHLVGHALLSTVAPLLLVLGHPLTLLRAVTAPAARARIDALLDAAPLRALNRPAVAWMVAAVAVFGVYATGLYDAVVLEHWAHPAMDALALGTGLALFRSILGSREPARPGFVQLGLLFAVMMLHAGFAIWLLVQSEPLAGQFYAAVAMPFVPDLLAAQRRGAVLAWLVSDLTMTVAALAVVRGWLAGATESTPPTPPTPAPALREV